MENTHDRRKYDNLWDTSLMGTIRADCPYFCSVLWCAPCASYSLRKQAIKSNMSKYKCCAGYRPCCSGLCGERWCPGLCLCMEVFCCFDNSVSSTRLLLQDRFNIQTTQCDNCIMTQHKIEMDRQDHKPMAARRDQQMSRLEQKKPPYVNHPEPGHGDPYLS